MSKSSAQVPWLLESQSVLAMLSLSGLSPLLSSFGLLRVIKIISFSRVQLKYGFMLCSCLLPIYISECIIHIFFIAIEGIHFTLPSAFAYLSGLVIYSV